MERRCIVSAVAIPPVDTREWVSFEDEDEERTWVFDVTFLTSNWKCIFGEGCQGVLTGPAPELVQGCCSYGAHLIDKKDARRVEKVAKTLTAEEWENHGSKKPVIITNKHGELVTRIKGDACVFLNSPGFGAGAGCALHLAALKRDVNPLVYKPEVCWQLPLRREDQVEEDGHVVSTIRQWDRRHWGKGGLEFHWWCTEDPEAFVGTKPVYQEMQAELTEMVGSTVFEQFLAYIQQRDQLRAQRVPLPHPAVRTRDAQNPVTQNPVIQNPVIQNPVIQNPVIQNPVAQNPAPQLADLASRAANLASQDALRSGNQHVSSPEHPTHLPE
jgi:hypothetical protein